jgi:circadian clock protein KaiC
MHISQDFQGFALPDSNLHSILGPLPLSTTVLILGHPGAGKSTFVASVVFENVLRFGVKGVYISLAEDKEKFYSYMRRLGMDFAVPEGKGLFEYVHVPTLTGRELVEVVVERLSQKIVEEGARIAVIDSVTPLLNALTTEEARSMLHATLYSLTSASKALLMLIADLPFATESTDLKGLEFIADAVFVFKTKIEKGIINRVMEVRKFRGKPIPLAEIPFTIEEGRSVRFLVPPLYSSITLPKTLLEVTHRCIEPLWGSVEPSTHIGIVTKVGEIPFSIWVAIVRLTHDYKLKLSIISFRDPPQKLQMILEAAAKAVNIVPQNILKRTLSILSVNPAILSPHQLMGMLVSEIERLPNILVIDRVDMLYLYYPSKLVDAMLHMISTHAKANKVIIIETTGNIYTKHQTPRYDLLHYITYRNGVAMHSVKRTRSTKPIVQHVRKLGDEALLKCFLG